MGIRMWQLSKSSVLNHTTANQATVNAFSGRSMRTSTVALLVPGQWTVVQRFRWRVFKLSGWITNATFAPSANKSVTVDELVRTMVALPHKYSVNITTAAQRDGSLNGPIVNSHMHQRHVPCRRNASWKFVSAAHSGRPTAIVARRH